MLVALAGELAPLAKKLQRPSSTEATVTIARIGLPIMRPSDTKQRHENVVCASVLSYGVNRPSWRLQPRPARLPLVTTRTTKHPALIPHEVPAGARRRTAIPARRGARRPAHAGNSRLSTSLTYRPPASFSSRADPAPGSA